MILVLTDVLSSVLVSLCPYGKAYNAWQHNSSPQAPCYCWEKRSRTNSKPDIAPASLSSWATSGSNSYARRPYAWPRCSDTCSRPQDWHRIRRRNFATRRTDCWGRSRDIRRAMRSSKPTRTRLYPLTISFRRYWRFWILRIIRCQWSDPGTKLWVDLTLILIVNLIIDWV